MRLRLGYLSAGDETDMLRRRVDRAAENAELKPVTTPAGVLAMRESLERVEITPDLLEYVVAIVTATRRDAQVQIGASPRGGLALVQLARGQALLSQRDYVVPDDIKQVAVPALAHRVTLARPELLGAPGLGGRGDDQAARLGGHAPHGPQPGGHRLMSSPAPNEVPSRPGSGTRKWGRDHARAALAVLAARPAAAHAGPRRRVRRHAGPATELRKGLAAPALLLLAAGRIQRRPPRIVVRARPSSRRGFQDEVMALDVSAGGQDDCDVRWTLHPGREIAPVRQGRGRRAGRPASPPHPGAVGAAGPGHAGRDAAGPLAAGRGHASPVAAPDRLLPRPGQPADRRVVLRRLPNRLGEHPVRVAGRGPGVLRRARLRAGRPAAQHQLAGQHPAQAGCR